MSFTRFHDDPCRITKQQQESTDQGKWILNVPGNGDKPCFMIDPSIRLQKWGANLLTNTTSPPLPTKDGNALRSNKGV